MRKYVVTGLLCFYLLACSSPPPQSSAPNTQATQTPVQTDPATRSVPVSKQRQRNAPPGLFGTLKEQRKQELESEGGIVGTGHKPVCQQADNSECSEALQ